MEQPDQIGGLMNQIKYNDPDRDQQGHVWIKDPDLPKVHWCSRCGRHRVEVPGWEDDPPCRPIQVSGGA